MGSRVSTSVPSLSTSAASAAPGEDGDERQNLLQPMTEMKHKDSVYSFMLFQPELSRQIYGHYWTPPVVLAGILLILNITLQVGLSWIAGTYISNQHKAFTVTLVNNEEGPSAFTIYQHVTEEVKGVHETLKEKIHGKAQADYCCNGAECSELEMTCCDRTGASPHEPHRPILVTTTTLAPESTSESTVVAASTAPPTVTPEAAASPAAAPSPAPSAAAEEGEETTTLEAKKDEESEEATTSPEVTAAGESADEKKEKRPGAGSFLGLANFVLKPGGGGGKKAASEDSKKGDTEDVNYVSMQKSSAICRLKNSTMDCAPSSFAFTGSWEDLDKDGDGLWTLEEARADEANLGCKLGMSVEEVFRSVCRGVVRDAKDTADHSYATPFVPFSVEQRRAIPKADFDQWRGLVTICVASDVARCSELVSKGIFDAVIGAPNPRMHRGGVVDLDSAIDYCQRLLVPGGLCEKTLPGTYMMYRARVSEKCGSPTYSPGRRHVNPHDERDVTSVVEVSYSNVYDYFKCSSGTFSFFLALILFLWYTNLVVEAQNILQLADFIINFPIDAKGSNPLLTPSMKDAVSRAGSHHLIWSASQSFRHASQSLSLFQAEPKAEEEGEALQSPDNSKVIKSISRLHKITCVLMFGVRCFLLGYMMDVGSIFLLYTKSYDDLLLNAVALAFIFDLPEFLYMFLVNDSIKGNLDDASIAAYPTMLPARGWRGAMINKSLWGIILIPSIVIAQVVYNKHVNILPGLEALRCTCFQEGENCKTAHYLQKDWWETYWQDVAKVDRLRGPHG
mmetsp:Transcript_86464/g.153116  ORF Transcript_86464/g.153116 Transcript_86464/m.153116 type:complete len:792 (-) Transcript_86464:78-2453(-)